MSVRVCPRCGFSHLRPSRAHTWFEHVQGWWTRTRWFRCQTCEWRGRIREYINKLANELALVEYGLRITTARA